MSRESESIPAIIALGNPFGEPKSPTYRSRGLAMGPQHMPEEHFCLATKITPSTNYKPQSERLLLTIQSPQMEDAVPFMF